MWMQDIRIGLLTDFFPPQFHADGWGLGEMFHYVIAVRHKQQNFIWGVRHMVNLNFSQANVINEKETDGNKSLQCLTLCADCYSV